MKKIIGIIVVILSSFNSFSQASDYTKPFSQIVSEKTTYFSSLTPAEMEEEGGEYREYKRWYNFWVTRIAPNGTMAEHNTMLANQMRPPRGGAKSAGNTDPWKELGPYDKPVAGIDDIGNGGSDRGIGVINSIFVCPTNPNKLLANSKAGGLFFSQDKGQNWTNAGSDSWPRSGCYSMAFAPNNESTWYASSATGGTYYTPPIGDNGGVYRTTNSGLLWSLIADKFDFDASASIGVTTFVNGIKINPVNPDIGYLATNLGLYKTTNMNDVTPTNVVWTKVLNDYVEDMEFRTDGSGTIFVSHKNTSGNWFVSKSTDQGATWTVLPSFTFPAGTTQVVLEVSENNNNLLYVLDRNSLTTLRTFNISTSTWTIKNTFSPMVGWGHGFGVSNFNANIIYVSNYDRFKKSTDGGTTFTTIVCNPSAPATRYHVDVEDIVTPSSLCATCGSSSGEVYVGTHGGVNFSPDNCNTLVTRSKGLGVAKINEPASAALNPEIISMGLDHDGTVLSNGTFGSNWIPGWKTIFGGDGGCTTIDYSNSNNIWFQPQVSVPIFSQDLGNTYTWTNFPSSNDFFTKLVQNNTFPQVVYTKARNPASTTYEEVYRSSYYGLSSGVTEQISNFAGLSLPANQWVWGIFPAPSNANYIYANVNANAPTWIGHFYRTTVAMSAASVVKTSWVEMPMPSGGNAKAVDNRNPNFVYVSAGGTPWDPSLRLYKVDYTNPSTALSSLLDLSGDPSTGGLPDVGINDLVLEKGSNGGIYVSTDLGVYYANNTTIRINNTNVSTWTKLGDNLPNIPLGKIEINYVANKIRVATPGRGIWEHDLFCPSTDDAVYSGAQNTSNYYEVYDEITSTAIVGASASVTYRAGTYILLNPGFSSVPNSSGYFEGFIHPCMYVGSSPNLNRENRTADQVATDEVKTARFAPEISLYPNPAEESVTLNIANDDVYEVVVFNQMGAEVSKIKETKVKDLKIDLSGLSSGLYIIRCSNAHDMKTIQMVKK